MNRKIRIFQTLMALMILTGLMAVGATPASAETVKDCKQWHTVVRGEYLSQIAKSYGTDWRTLVEINALGNPNVIFPGQKLCISLTTKITPTTPSPSGTGVKVYASSVREDKSVTLQGKDLLASTRYTIYLSNYKAKFTTMILVGSVVTDPSGTFKVTYNLPKKLADVTKIKITATSIKGGTATNWFYNLNLDGNTGGTSAPVLSFVIDSAKKNNWVKIKISNLPANVTLNVYMGKAGSEAVKGILVGTVWNAKGGTVTATFNIPSELVDKSKLDLRLESTPYELVVFRTFENKTQ